MRDQRGILSIFSCKSGEPFFHRVVSELKSIVGDDAMVRTPKTEEVHFSNGEVKTIIHDFIRGNDVYIIQAFDTPSTPWSIHDNLMALFTAIDAAKHADADSITAVIPQFPYSKHDKTRQREGIGARLIAAMLEDAGVDRIITLDIHEKAIQGFFNHARLDNLYASREFMKYIKQQERDYDNLVFVAHDLGAAEIARYYANYLNVDMAIVRAYSESHSADEKWEFQLVGNVKGKDIIIVKDMISTGRTVVKAIDILLEKGAKSVTLFTSFPFFNLDAAELFTGYYNEGKIRAIVGTDGVQHTDQFKADNPWYQEISVAGLFAEVINQVNHNQSIAVVLDY